MKDREMTDKEIEISMKIISFIAGAGWTAFFICFLGSV